jgi:hypothetical protein
MEAPAWFLKELAEFDSDMRLRWSRRLELWQLERRVRRGLHPGTILCDNWHDDYIRARDGYLLVASVPPKQLSREVFEHLRASDLWARGGWQKVSDDLDELDRRREEDIQESFAREMHEINKDVFEWWKLRDGETVYNAGYAQ